jgi:AcrR family transcriptional regulator
MKKHPEIQEATRRNFAEALIALYGAQPLEKISVQALAEKAGYNRATFYRYFGSIYDLYGYAEEFALSAVKQEILTFYKARSFDTDFVSSFAGLYSKWSPYLDLVLDDLGSARTAKIKSDFIREFCLANGMPADDIELEYVLDMYMSCVLSAINKWRRDDRGLPYERLGALVQKLLTEGVLPQLRRYAAPGA